MLGEVITILLFTAMVWGAVKLSNRPPKSGIPARAKPNSDTVERSNLGQMAAFDVEVRADNSGGSSGGMD
ncbi:MAG: hypothetical protein JXR15_08295 [Shimia sp.]|uniref:hypothetical protein n=1 Tax=Shimia sp. TaxID=1954381 RepID=UPI003B8BE09A